MNLQGSLKASGVLQGSIYVPSTVGGDPYDGNYLVEPNFEGTVLKTKGKLLQSDVVINPIAVSRVTNPSGGKTIYIGGTTNG